MLEFLQNPYTWIIKVFSGIISWILGKRNGYNKVTKQNMKIGNNNNNITQVGGSVHDSFTKK